MLKKTVLGYEQYRCRDCAKQFNERTGSKLNYIEYRPEIVMLVVHHYYRFKLSLSDVVELMAMRGITLSHQTVSNWVQTFGVELGLKLRERRRYAVGQKWHVDATYIKLSGRWCYLYRAIDKAGHLVDVYLSDVLNIAAAKKFFNQAIETTGIIPNQITTDKEPAFYSAIKATLPHAKHRDSKFMNNLIEQDHRGIKLRCYSMKGFKNFFSALIFCTAFEEIRQLFKMKNKTRAQQRRLISSKFQDFNQLFNCIA